MDVDVTMVGSMDTDAGSTSKKKEITEDGSAVQEDTEEPMDEPMRATERISKIADLVVRCATTNFLVSAETLRLASPVWMKVLDPDSKFKALGTEDIEGVTLRILPTDDEDDPDTLRLIFNILHYCFMEIPEHLQYDQLEHLAVLCDKWDCKHAVRPWVRKWIRELIEGRVPNIKMMATQGNWFFIGKTFSYVPETQTLVVSMCLDVIKHLYASADLLNNKCRNVLYLKNEQGQKTLPRPLEVISPLMPQNIEGKT